MDKIEVAGDVGRTQETLPLSGLEPGQVQLKMRGLLKLWRIMALTWAALAIVGISLPFIFLELKHATLTGALLLLLLGIVLIAALAIAWFYAGKRFTAYESRLFPGQGVRIRSGVLWRKEIWLPIARLQHLDVNQGPLERKWDMASLVLHTAGTHDHEIAVQGLSPRAAQELREVLMPRQRVQHD